MYGYGICGRERFPSRSPSPRLTFASLLQLVHAEPEQHDRGHILVVRLESAASVGVLLAGGRVHGDVVEDAPERKEESASHSTQISYNTTRRDTTLRNTSECMAL